MAPEGWTTSRLGDCVSFRSGGTPSKQRPDFWGGSVPWVSAKDLKSHLISDAQDHLTDLGAQQAKMAAPTNVLMLVRGMTLLKDVPIGFVTKAVAFNQDLKALVANDDVDPKFLSYLLVAKKLQMMGLVNTANHGTGRLDTDLLKGLPVDVPPLPEQRKIADILSTWHAAIEKTEALLTTARTQKRALMQSLLTGRRRFPEFESQLWQTGDFKDLFVVANDKKTQVNKRDYLHEGETPVVDQGQEFIVGYTDHEQRYTDVPVILFGDHTRALKWVDFGFCPGADGTQLLKTTFKLDQRLGFYLLQNLELPNLGYSRHMRELKQSIFDYPTSQEEQKKLASVLSEADAEIMSLESIQAKLRAEKKALMQQLLTGKRRVLV